MNFWEPRDTYADPAIGPTPADAFSPAPDVLPPPEISPPEVISYSAAELAVPCDIYPLGMQAALQRAPRFKVRTAVLNAAAPKVVSIPISRAPVKVRSFLFPALTEALLAKERGQQQPPPPPKPQPKPATPSSEGGQARDTRRVRMRPPRDIVKLEDRLMYLLEPPVETWLARESLSFPFQPFPYQLEGIAFLYPRTMAVLADEMGLGKTMQAITSVRLLLHSREVSSVLLVCPKPLVSNWKREFALWAPEVPVVVIEGDQAKRRFQWLLPAPVKIANYELLQRDQELVLAPDRHFDLVVLDESQRIKNRGSTTSQIVRSISRNRSWALTGTPVENCAEDLIGIFEFLSPGYLGNHMTPRQLGDAASEHVLRRTKDKVLTDMPPRLFRDVEIDLGPEQRESYRLAEEEGVLRLTEMGDSATIQHVFELVLRLKQIANFDPATGESAKLDRLKADLEEVAASGRKAIVFSQWVWTLQRLAKELVAFNPLEYHGKIPPKKRDGIIEEFRNNPNRHVMLISYGAGGVGLNLQFSQYVFLFDRWWNPAIEDQAINRAHRIGAAGAVTVSRFLAVGTIEQRIDEILREKRELFETIFSGTEPGRKLGLTQEEVFGLFKLKCPTGPIKFAA